MIFTLCGWCNHCYSTHANFVSQVVFFFWGMVATIATQSKVVSYCNWLLLRNGCDDCNSIKSCVILQLTPWRWFIPLNMIDIWMFTLTGRQLSFIVVSTWDWHMVRKGLAKVVMFVVPGGWCAKVTLKVCCLLLHKRRSRSASEAVGKRMTVGAAAS